LKKLPEDINSLSSLKVLAIQRNKIEKLPLSLGDMTSLRMLKFDDNPIVFPPADILQLEPNSVINASASEAEAQLTVQIKKFLKQAATAVTNRQRLQVESDSDFRYRVFSRCQFLKLTRDLK
jgi:Leucine-rich repeat (LRR) protein